MKVIMTNWKYTLNAQRQRSGATIPVSWGLQMFNLIHHLAHPCNGRSLAQMSFREAWLRLSMQYHPDLNQDDEKAAQRFLEIKEAYTGEPPSWTFL